jgi:anti-sigma B factor antagonist
MFHHDNLEIDQREREGIIILDLKGHLVMGAGDTALREYVQALLDGGNRRLILNMAGVSNLDTIGSGALLFLAEEYRKAGGRLVVFQVSHVHAEVYEMAHLEAAMDVCSDELDAVNSFFPDRAVAHYDILEFVEQLEHQGETEKNK